MTVLPPGLTALPDVPPILDQIEPWPSRSTADARHRSPMWAVAFVALVVLTIAAGASVLRDRSGDTARPAVPVGAVELVAGSAGPASGS